MSTRVLATQEAKECIAHMRAVIGGGLLDSIGQLQRDGERLSDPNVWDGSHALYFRDLWAQVGRSLTTAQQQLQDLQARVDAITNDILTAGGV
jgi:hypothetical protein